MARDESAKPWTLAAFPAFRPRRSSSIWIATVATRYIQNAAGEIVALKAPIRGGNPTVLWATPGAAMSPAGGYIWNGPFCPQAADVDGDGFPEVVFAAADEAGQCTVICADGRTGKAKWRRPIEGGLGAGPKRAWTRGHSAGLPIGRRG